MRYLGIDFGAKRIGLAISNEERTIAFPHSTIANDEQAIEAIVAIVKEKNIQTVVIGDTRSHGGLANPITADAERFAEALEEHAQVPVKKIFEIWSSVEASRYADKGKEHDDASAAAVILQRFLEMKAKTVE